jgi:hypothetical protein
MEPVQAPDSVWRGADPTTQTEAQRCRPLHAGVTSFVAWFAVFACSLPRLQCSGACVCDWYASQASCAALFGGGVAGARMQHKLKLSLLV